jgi:putative NADH-flavin reductase
LKIAVIGASGTVGSQVTHHLLNHGHTISAIQRNTDKLPAHPRLIARPADIFNFDQLRAALPGHDALVVAFAPKDNSYPAYMRLVEAAWRIKRVFKELLPDAYLMNVGGASSLWTPRGFQMFEDPLWPQWFFNAGSPAHWRRLYGYSGFEVFREMAEQRERILSDPSQDPHANFTGEIIDKWYREIDEIFGKGMGGRTQLEFFICDNSFRWSFVSPPWLLGQTEVIGKYRTTIDTLPVEDGHPAGISVSDLGLAIADAVHGQSFVHQHWSAARPLAPGVTG